MRGLPHAAHRPARVGADRYELRPLLARRVAFGPIELRVRSPLGLAARARRGRRSDAPRVSELRGDHEYALLATDHRLSQIGVLQRQRRGEGLDFHQLREYREGDTQRQIDWKATSRAGKLISREYQDERDQNIVFLVDCGRRVGAHDGALSHFDHVLNAVLLLAYVSLRQGDAAGFLTMSGRGASWRPASRRRPSTRC